MKLAVRLRKPKTLEQADAIGEVYVDLGREMKDAETRHAPVIAACERALSAANKARDKEVRHLAERRARAEHLIGEWGLEEEHNLLRGTRRKWFMLPISRVALRFNKKPDVELEFDDEPKVIIKRIQDAGHADTLLRAEWRLHRTNIKDPKNRALVESIKGIRLVPQEGDEVTVAPN
jgi:hypothetical protein